MTERHAKVCLICAVLNVQGLYAPCGTHYHWFDVMSSVQLNIIGNAIQVIDESKGDESLSRVHHLTGTHHCLY